MTDSQLYIYIYIQRQSERDKKQERERETGKKKIQDEQERERETLRTEGSTTKEPYKHQKRPGSLSKLQKGVATNRYRCTPADSKSAKETAFRLPRLSHTPTQYNLCNTLLTHTAVLASPVPSLPDDKEKTSSASKRDSVLRTERLRGGDSDHGRGEEREKGGKGEGGGLESKASLIRESSVMSPRSLASARAESKAARRASTARSCSRTGSMSPAPSSRINAQGMSSISSALSVSSQNAATSSHQRTASAAADVARHQEWITANTFPATNAVQQQQNDPLFHHELQHQQNAVARLKAVTAAQTSGAAATDSHQDNLHANARLGNLRSTSSEDVHTRPAGDSAGGSGGSGRGREGIGAGRGGRGAGSEKGGGGGGGGGGGEDAVERLKRVFSDKEQYTQEKKSLLAAVTPSSPADSGFTSTMSRSKPTQKSI